MSKNFVFTGPNALFMLLAALVLAVPFDAGAVPSFSRQTGMSCNQCHTLHGGPVPNFTMTGKKFRAYGYRIPSIKDSLQSGEPGDQGERLNLLNDFFSVRFQSDVYSKTKSPGAASYSEATTNPTTRLAGFYAGPIGDNMGLWTEMYFIPTGSANQEWSLGLASFEEFDLRWVFNPDNPSTSFGMSLTNQSVNEIAGFGPFPVNIGGGFAGRAGINGWAHPNYANVLFTGWVNDRHAFNIGLNTGDTNPGWDRYNWVGAYSYAFLNTNAHELWLNTAFRVGHDVLPLTSVATVPTNTRDFSYVDRIAGVAATRAGGNPYVAADIDNAKSYMAEVRWSRQDYGPHSFEAILRYTTNSEDYTDGGRTKLSSVGGILRYGWRHTWYFGPYWRTDDYKFRDRLGVDHAVDSNPDVGVWFGYKPYENVLLNFQVARTETLRLDQPPVTGGRIYSLTLDFLY